MILRFLSRIIIPHNDSDNILILNLTCGLYCSLLYIKYILINRMNVGENYMDSIIYPNFLGAESRLPYYPAGIGINHVQEQIIRPWGYHQYQWIQCRSGMGELFIGDKRYVLSERKAFNSFLIFGIAFSCTWCGHIAYSNSAA